MSKLIFTYKVNVAIIGRSFRTFTELPTLNEAKNYASMWEKQGYSTKIECICAQKG